ncbi:hypothetical protein GJAV_G00200680 [Gymnothorax javanicus]|nr:hypothetical protein GJAV_G00200680 [Gymnothorax javanicus]
MLSCEVYSGSMATERLDLHTGACSKEFPRCLELHYTERWSQPLVLNSELALINAQGCAVLHCSLI